MDERHLVLTELEAARERAADLLRAKLDAIAAQIREAAARAAGDLEVVVPPDLEMLLPLAPAAELLATPAPPPPAPGVDLEAVRRLDAGRAQSDVLRELLELLGAFCGARAVLVFRDGEVLCWSGADFPDPAALRSWRARLADSPALAAAAEGRPVRFDAGADAVFSALVGGAEPALLVPMSLRGKVVGAALAVAREGALAVEQVQLLTYLAGVMLETLSVRPAVPTAALAEPLSLQPEEPPVETVETPFPAAEAVPFEEPAPVAAAPAAEPPAAAAVPVAASEAPAPVETAPATPPARFEPVPATRDVAAVAAPVAPAAALSPEEEQRHNEARRFARLLVSEIRLYNEAAVQAGKVSRDIYQRLKDDIDRSREMYEQRVPADVRASSNYFFEELVRILADGDPDALGV